MIYLLRHAMSMVASVFLMLRCFVLVASAQIEPGIRDQVVPAAIQIAVNVEWRENDLEWDYPLPVGSGTIVAADGLILTNYHVVDSVQIEALVADWNRRLSGELPNVELSIVGDDFLILVSDGVHPPEHKYTAEIVRTDAQLDLAVLRVVGDADGSPDAVSDTIFPFVPLGDSNTLRLGDQIQVFSYPSIGGDALTFTDGVVSGFLYDGSIEGIAWITTNAVMSGGSSGGTAINHDGQLIGVPTQGTELDCRPGDTNLDGSLTVEDVGCIPIGGSLGQLRPINLAIALLSPESAGQLQGGNAPREDAPESTGPGVLLDLPRLPLTPVELSAQGLDGYAIGWGQLNSASGVPSLLQVPDLSVSELEEFGLDEVYVLKQVPLHQADSEKSDVTTMIWAYADEAGARAGFDLVERDIESTLIVRDEPGSPGVGEESEVSSWRFADSTTGDEAAVVELTFRVGRLVGSVSKTGPVGTERDMKTDVEVLGEELERRLTAALREFAAGPISLSSQILRLTDEVRTDATDEYYLIADGAALPLYWHENEARVEEWTDYWREVGINDAYQFEMFLPSASTTPTARIGIRLYAFANAANASSFVRSYDGDLRSLGASSLKEHSEVSTYGDESRNFSYESDWWPEMDPEYRVETVMRVDDIVATIEIGSSMAIPLQAMRELEREQEICLKSGCRGQFQAIPDGLIFPERPLQTTATLQPAPTPRPSPTPVPTSTPTPTPTSIWGYIETFDQATAIVPIDNNELTAHASNGIMVLTIKAPGSAQSFDYDQFATDGRNFNYTAKVSSTTGDGEINLRARTLVDNAEWTFSVDPVDQAWSLYRKSTSTGGLFYWVEPRGFAALAPGPIRDISIRVRDGVPVLLVNGVDVVTPTGIAMPNMGGSVVVGFGAGINPYSSSESARSFTVVFDQLVLAEAA